MLLLLSPGLLIALGWVGLFGKVLVVVLGLLRAVVVAAATLIVAIVVVCRFLLLLTALVSLLVSLLFGLGLLDSRLGGCSHKDVGV